MWSELKLWLIGAAGLAVLVLVWVGITELINRSWHDLGTSASASFVLIMILVIARVLAGIWAEVHHARRSGDEQERDFRERLERVRRAMRGSGREE